MMSQPETIAAREVKNREKLLRKTPRLFIIMIRLAGD